MKKTHLTTAAISVSLLLSACAENQFLAVTAESEVSRLQSMGYKVVANGVEGNTTVLRYSGPINASVECGRTNQMRTMQPKIVSSSGAVQEFKLNSYLSLSQSADGLIRSGDRDGLYVVSKTTRPSSRAAATNIETITFEPGGRGKFPSGLSCRAT